MPDILIEVNAKEQTLLRTRADDLSRLAAQSYEAGTEKRTLDCLFFSAQGIRYALSQDWVQEVHLEVRPIPVPCTPSFVRGIVNVRGDIVSAVDISAFLGNTPLAHQENYQMFRIRKGKLEFGILCDLVDNIEPLSLEHLHRYEHGDHAKMNRYLLGVTDELVNILDAEALMADESLIVS